MNKYCSIGDITIDHNPFHLNDHYAQEFLELVKWYNGEPNKAQKFLDKYDYLWDTYYEWLGDQ